LLFRAGGSTKKRNKLREPIRRNVNEWLACGGSVHMEVVPA